MFTIPTCNPGRTCVPCVPLVPCVSLLVLRVPMTTCVCHLCRCAGTWSRDQHVPRSCRFGFHVEGPGRALRARSARVASTQSFDFPVHSYEFPSVLCGLREGPRGNSLRASRPQFFLSTFVRDDERAFSKVLVSPPCRNGHRPPFWNISSGTPRNCHISAFAC